MSEHELRMNAYYYSFEPTGVREIDLILSAVACAGKAFHHTESWGEDGGGTYESAHRGATPVEWIQNAANDAAAALRASPPARETAADTRRAWLRNSLRSCAEHERKQAAHCRKAHRVEPYRSMSHEMADAHDEAAAVFERRLTAEDIR